MNVEHRTSNVQHRIKKQTSNTEHSTTPRRGFFSAVLILVTKILINSSVSTKISSNSSGFKLCFFIFSHSAFDVGRSMFDVHFFQSVLGKNNLALMAQTPLPFKSYTSVDCYRASTKSSFHINAPAHFLDFALFTSTMYNIPNFPTFESCFLLDCHGTHSLFAPHYYFQDSLSG